MGHYHQHQHQHLPLPPWVVSCGLLQAPEGWPEVPVGPWLPPPPPQQSDPSPPRLSRHRTLVLDLQPLEEVALPPFDTFETFCVSTFPLRAPYFAEQYYLLDMVQRVHSIALWCYLLVPRSML